MPFRLRALALAAAIVAFWCAVARAQATSPGPSKSAISGVVTADGRPSPGVLVVAWKVDENRDPRTTPMTPGGRQTETETDDQGRYRFESLEPGLYVVSANRVGYYPTTERPLTYSGEGQVVRLADGEGEASVDVSLTHGGAITGRVVDPSGRPLVGVMLSVETRDEEGEFEDADNFMASSLKTDDRGVYRAYGLAPGRYYVAVEEYGAETELVPKTYYPATKDPEAAKAVEVDGAGDAAGVDIVVAIRRPRPRVVVSGRVSDADSKEPVPGVRVYLNGSRDDESVAGLHFFSDSVTDATGAYAVRNVPAGRYRATVYRKCGDKCSYPAGAIDVDASVDRGGVDISSPRGSAVGGRIVSNASPASPAAAPLTGINVSLIRDDSSDASPPFVDRGTVEADGSFVLSGVPPGTYRVHVYASGASQGYHLARVEGAGVSDRDTIVVKPGSDVSGLRAFVDFGACAVRVRVRFANGTPAPRTSIGVMVVGVEPSSYAFPRADERGEFVQAGLLPGRYEVSARVSGAAPVTETVELSAGRPSSDVTLTIDLSVAEPADGDDEGDEDDER